MGSMMYLTIWSHVVDKGMTDSDLVRMCLLNNTEGQRALYNRYSARMMSLCLRYTGSRDEAEDILQEGFIQVFRSLKQYTGKGSLEGWIRTIIIHIAVRKWHKQHDHLTERIDDHFELHDHSVNAIEKISSAELKQMISRLPDGYRLVFNMFAIDGYSHAEIAAITGIKEGTSRSQLVKARMMLQRMLIAAEPASKQYRDDNR